MRYNQEKQGKSVKVESFPKILQTPYIPAVLLLLFLLPALSGCFEEKKEQAKVVQPPYVPELPEPPSASDTRPPNLTDIRAYADLMEMGDPGRHHPRLVDAIANAIRAGVLKPASLDDRFEPDANITYGEFRDWTLNWQNALADSGYGIRMNDGGNLQKPRYRKGGAPRELTAYRRDALSSPMNPEKLMILPESMAWEEQTMDANAPLTRETLCALYVFLSQQEEKARALSSEKIENMTPGDGAIQAEESLMQFKDYEAISPAARRYVAIAYKDRVVQKVFRLTPDKLAIDEGFNPRMEASREDAILLLDHLYGRYRVTGKQPRTLEAVAPTSPAAAATPIKAAAPTKSDLEAEPQVLNSKSTYTESGPGYSRKASKINVPR